MYHSTEILKTMYKLMPSFFFYINLFIEMQFFFFIKEYVIAMEGTMNRLANKTLGKSSLLNIVFCLPTVSHWRYVMSKMATFAVYLNLMHAKRSSVLSTSNINKRLSIVCDCGADARVMKFYELQSAIKLFMTTG